jgi:hypothetical protein
MFEHGLFRTRVIHIWFNQAFPWSSLQLIVPFIAIELLMTKRNSCQNIVWCQRDWFGPKMFGQKREYREKTLKCIILTLLKLRAFSFYLSVHKSYQFTMLWPLFVRISYCSLRQLTDFFLNQIPSATFSEFRSWLGHDPPFSDFTSWLRHGCFKFSDLGSWLHHDYPKFSGSGRLAETHFPEKN